MDVDAGYGIRKIWRQTLPLPLSGCDLGQVIFSLWTNLLIYKMGTGKKRQQLGIDNNNASLVQVL